MPAWAGVWCRLCRYRPNWRAADCASCCPAGEWMLLCTGTTGATAGDCWMSGPGNCSVRRRSRWLRRPDGAGRGCSADDLARRIGHLFYWLCQSGETMRDDFKGDLPGIRATDEDRVGAVSPGRPGSAPEPPLVRAVREPVIQRQRNGALWAVCVCLLLALIGLGYWSHQQQRLLQQQLVATQESFARISKDAAGRLQDISGKVIATESSLSEREKERIRQINELEEKVGQLAAALQEQEQLQQRQQQTLQTATQHLQEL